MFSVTRPFIERVHGALPADRSGLYRLGDGIIADIERQLFASPADAMAAVHDSLDNAGFSSGSALRRRMAGIFQNAAEAELCRLVGTDPKTQEEYAEEADALIRDIGWDTSPDLLADEQRAISMQPWIYVFKRTSELLKSLRQRKEEGKPTPSSEYGPILCAFMGLIEADGKVPALNVKKLTRARLIEKLNENSSSYRAAPAEVRMHAVNTCMYLVDECNTLRARAQARHRDQKRRETPGGAAAGMRIAAQ